MKKIIFWGATGQAVVLEEFINTCGFELAAVFDNNNQVKSPFKLIPIYYGFESLDKWINQSNEVIHYAIAIGGDKGRDRIFLNEELKKRGLKPASLIHPKSFVASNSSIGEGFQMMANASVCARTVIGNQVIVNTSSSIDHECHLGDGVHIGPGAVLAGCVNIGNNTFIGTGAIVLPRLNIGANTIIGAGSVVNRDIPEKVIAFGNPARVIKKI